MALSDPGKINAATVQDVKRCLELLGELEARLPKEKEESCDKALSPENAQAIREAFQISSWVGSTQSWEWPVNQSKYVAACSRVVARKRSSSSSWATGTIFTPKRSS